MALCIPDQIPDKASVGEKRVFILPRALPQDCIVYYEPKIDRRRPDFVVISPTLGPLVIEVKRVVRQQSARRRCKNCFDQNTIRKEKLYSPA
jgi:hypothetical protein